MAYNLQSFMQRIAAVAVRLKTPRKINGVDFDGTQDITINAAGGSPGGSDTQIQYNNDGAFAGDSGLVYKNGRVGIGTSNPTASIEVSSAGDGDYVPVAHFFAPKNTGMNHASQIRFGVNAVQAAEWRYVPNSSGRIDFVFSGIAQPAFSYLYNGNVGINTTAPTEKLDVVGNVKVSGTIQGSFKASDGSAGATGTFTIGTSSVVVKNGLIISVT